MRQWVLFIIMSIAALTAMAAGGDEGRDDPKYPVSTINEELLENAHAVVRMRDVTFTVLSRSETMFREHAVYTILNEKAKSLAMLYEMYNPLVKIIEFDAIVYDKEGNVIRKLKKSDITDQSYVSGASLFDDNRVQYADMKQPDYPYTVEFITERVVKKYYETPEFLPVFSDNISVEQSSLTLIAPDELMPRFREFNYDWSRFESSISSGKKIRWEVNNLKAINYEPFSGGLRSYAPYIETAPSIFEYEGYAGDMNTWESFGKWVWQLNEGRDDLPPAVVDEVKKLTEGLSDREKIKAVYEFMQNRTRYVNISMGIGALQPFEASVVNSVGYGDCKALSNYTVSLIREIGIDAYYVLIYAGRYPQKLDPDFPAHSFNHAIVSVPLEKDTVWLECTSQTKSFNYMGDFTENRDALMITENGGLIVKTPKYGLEANQRIRKVKVNFDEGGNANVEANTRYTGIQYDLQDLNGYVYLSKDDQKKWVLRNTEIPSFDLVSFNMKNFKDEIPSAKVDLSLRVARYASMTGKRFYFEPNIMSRIDANYKSTSTRQSDFISEYDLTYLDTVEYSFSSSYQLEYLPEPIIYESEFGRYETSMEFIQGKLMYFRKLEIYSGEFDPEKYQEFINFSEKLKSLDKSKVVFTTKT